MKLGTIKSRKKARIEVIPLIDIMFFLLATFVLISLKMTENKGLNVALPKSSTNESKSNKATKDNKDITITINSSGSLFLDKTETTLEDLKLKLSQEQGLEERSLILLGDESSRLDKTIEVLDLAKELKFGSVLVRTKSKN